MRTAIPAVSKPYLPRILNFIRKPHPVPMSYIFSFSGSGSLVTDKFYISPKLPCLFYNERKSQLADHSTVGDTRSPRSVASWHFRRHYFWLSPPFWGDMALPFVCIPDQSWPNCASSRELPMYSQVCMPNIPLTSPIPNNRHSMSIATRFCACGTKQA